MAFASLVFSELLRSFGARSATKHVWQISLRTNLTLVAVVVTSFAIQVWSQHNETLERFFKTTSIPLSHSLLLMAAGVIPLMGLEIMKAVNREPAARSAVQPA